VPRSCASLASPVVCTGQPTPATARVDKRLEGHKPPVVRLSTLGARCYRDHSTIQIRGDVDPGESDSGPRLVRMRAIPASSEERPRVVIECQLHCAHRSATRGALAGVRVYWGSHTQRTAGAQCAVETRPSNPPRLIQRASAPEQADPHHRAVPAKQTALLCTALIQPRLNAPEHVLLETPMSATESDPAPDSIMALGLRLPCCPVVHLAA